MKFRLIAYIERETIFNTSLGEYHIQSLCRRYNKTISTYEYTNNLENGIVNFYNECALERVTRRLEKIGVQVSFIGNYPWVYLREVNGIEVKEAKNAKHGYCVTYNHLDKRNLRFRKDLFNKIREVINENQNN